MSKELNIAALSSPSSSELTNAQLTKLSMQAVEHENGPERIARAAEELKAAVTDFNRDTPTRKALSAVDAARLASLERTATALGSLMDTICRTFRVYERDIARALKLWIDLLSSTETIVLESGTVVIPRIESESVRTHAFGLVDDVFRAIDASVASATARLADESKRREQDLRWIDDGMADPLFSRLIEAGEIVWRSPHLSQRQHVISIGQSLIFFAKVANCNVWRPAANLLHFFHVLMPAWRANLLNRLEDDEPAA